MIVSDGSNPVQLTSLGAWTGAARWSPDGQQIAFSANAKGNFDIYVVSAEGGLPRRLTTETADAWTPSWSKDGRWVYFFSKRSGDFQVCKMPVEGGDAVQITRQGGIGPFESPDGKFVYYAKIITPGIWRVPVEGGDEIPVLESSIAAYHWAWALVNDGIYYINPEAKDGAAIEFFSFATHQIRKIAGLGKANIGYGFAVSPDRHSILYTQVDQATSDIMLVENFR